MYEEHIISHEYLNISALLQYADNKTKKITNFVEICVTTFQTKLQIYGGNSNNNKQRWSSWWNYSMTTFKKYLFYNPETVSLLSTFQNTNIEC